MLKLHVKMCVHVMLLYMHNALCFVLDESRWFHTELSHADSSIALESRLLQNQLSTDQCQMSTPAADCTESSHDDVIVIVHKSMISKQPMLVQTLSSLVLPGMKRRLASHWLAQHAGHVSMAK